MQISIGHCLVNGFHCSGDGGGGLLSKGEDRVATGGEWANPSDLSRINLSASRQIGICRRRRARCKTQLHGPTDLLWSTVGEEEAWAGGDLLADVTVAVVVAACVCALTVGRGAPSLKYNNGQRGA